MNGRPVSIRPATAADVPTMVTFLRQMLADMAAVGGYPVTRNADQSFDKEWTAGTLLSRRCVARLSNDDYLATPVRT